MATQWGLLTNHALVLVHVVENPRSTVSQIADRVGITDRATTAILRTLEDDGIVTRQKIGRSNTYTVDIEKLLAHRSYGSFSIAQIASALLILSGRTAEGEMPPGLQQTTAIAMSLDGASPAAATVESTVTPFPRRT